MDTNEPGREPTDAELLRDLAMMRHRADMEKTEDAFSALHAAQEAVSVRGLNYYLSGQRPMPDTPAPDEQDATLVKLIDLLTRTANAVKGQPGEMKQHGWADLPELCTALAARVAEFEHDAALLRALAKTWEDFSAKFQQDAKVAEDRVAELEAVVKAAVVWRCAGVRLKPVAEDDLCDAIGDYLNKTAPGKEPTSE